MYERMYAHLYMYSYTNCDFFAFLHKGAYMHMWVLVYKWLSVLADVVDSIETFILTYIRTHVHMYIRILWVRFLSRF